MSIELKPCPFCPDGGIPISGGVLGETADGMTRYSQTTCDKCDCCGPQAATDEGADRLWNTRTPERSEQPVELGEFLPCPFCGSAPSYYQHEHITRVCCDNDDCAASNYNMDGDKWNARITTKRESRYRDSDNGWQPIETAPKDGAWILGYGKQYSVSKYPLVMFWDGAWIDVRANGDRDSDDLYPTHWMPLPKPPEGV